MTASRPLPGDASPAVSRTASQRITEVVTSWAGVQAGPGRRGEFAFRVEGREIGHLHGDHAAHFNFPGALWRELMEEGRIGVHPVFPRSVGPAARRITSESDVQDVMVLMRLNYDRLVQTPARPATAQEQS